MDNLNKQLPFANLILVALFVTILSSSTLGYDITFLTPLGNPGTDADCNGVNDWWEQWHDFPINDPALPSPDLDSDGDGISDYDEGIRGTNPYQQDSFAIQIRLEGERIVLGMNTFHGNNYTIEGKASLSSGEWVEIAQFYGGLDSNTEASVPLNGSLQFFRVLAWPLNIDCDEGCDEGWLSQYRCSGNWRQRLWRDANCDERWMNYEYCPEGCSNDACRGATCDERWLNQYGCSGNWRQKLWRDANCDERWMNYEYCSQGCSNGACRSSTCIEQWLSQYRCSGNWRQRLWRNMDCSEIWMNLEYCIHGCANNACRIQTSYCGDGVCNQGETCANCPQDCGVCPTPLPIGYCGDGICKSGETCSSCPQDCGRCVAPLPVIYTCAQLGGSCCEHGGTGALSGAADCPSSCFSACNVPTPEPAPSDDSPTGAVIVVDSSVLLLLGVIVVLTFLLLLFAKR
jgi:hypothetical protein